MSQENLLSALRVLGTQRISLLAWSLLAMSASCASPSPNGAKSADLDIVMHRKTPDIVQNFAGAKKPGSATSAEMSAEEQLAWKQFFRPPPAVDTRTTIEKKILAWKNTNSPEDLVKRGQNESTLGKLAAAEASFREALRLDSTNLDAALELAGIYLRKNDLTRCFEMLSQVRDGINMKSQTPPALVFRYRYVLALGYIARGDRDKGHKILSDQIGINKGFAPGYAALASSYISLGKDSVAEFIVKRGLDRGAEDSMLLNILGVLAERRNEGTAARAWYNKAIEAAPTYSPALVNRANLAIKETDYGPAEEDLLRALMYSPSNIDAQVALAIVLRRTGRITGAREILSKAVDQDPDSAVARFNLGILMMSDLKQPAAATRLFTEVLQIPGTHADLRNQAKTHLAELSVKGQPDER